MKSIAEQIYIQQQEHRRDWVKTKRIAKKLNTQWTLDALWNKHGQILAENGIKLGNTDSET